jgi:hypothetical protein
MPLLNYSTKIPTDRTIGEIQQILARAGVKAVNTMYDDGRPVDVAFVIELGTGIDARPVSFRLPANTAAVQRIMEADKAIPRHFVNEEQAERVAWRIVRSWVQAQMAFIEAGQASLAQLFLPHAVDQSGRTLYEKFTGEMLLTGGEHD